MTVEHRSAAVNFPAVTGLRAVAALAVLVYHCALPAGTDENSPLGWLIGRLPVAVPIFFAITGFLIYRPFAAAAHGGPGIDVARYLWNRAWRIFPAYWVVLAACALIPAINDPYTEFSPLEQVWRHITLTQVYTDDLRVHGLVHTWTLNVEIAYYAVLPVLAALLATRRGLSVRAHVAALAAIGAGCLAFRVIAWETGAPIPLQATVAAVGLWLVGGMALAVLTVAAPQNRFLRTVHRHPVACWVAAFGVLALSGRIGLPRRLSVDWTALQWGADHVSYALVAVLLIAPLTGPAAARGPLARNPMLWFGEISYSVYLWHYPLVFVNLHLVGEHPSRAFVTLLAATLAMTVPVAAASYYLVERTGMRLRTRWRRAPRPVPATA